jgi:Protein ENHANCED DISEASE RESISTANCE 2, C-terminal
MPTDSAAPCDRHRVICYQTPGTRTYRFLEGEGPAADKRRNNRFKLIPHILKSPWVVKQAVGTTPVLLGNKLVTKYFRWALCASHSGEPFRSLACYSAANCTSDTSCHRWALANVCANTCLRDKVHAARHAVPL